MYKCLGQKEKGASNDTVSGHQPSPVTIVFALTCNRGPTVAVRTLTGSVSLLTDWGPDLSALRSLPCGELAFVASMPSAAAGDEMSQQFGRLSVGTPAEQKSPPCARRECSPAKLMGK